MVMKQNGNRKDNLGRYKTENALLLKHYMAEQHRIAALEESMRYARHLHNALLPDESQLRQTTGEAFALNLPKETLGGDFYWCARAGKKTIIAMADCTGHGIPGALMSVLGISLLNQIVLEERTFEPAHILRRLDYKMRLTFKHTEEQSRSGYDGMDIALCVIDTFDRTINFAGAMRPLYYVSNGKTTIYPGVRYPIGGLRLEGQRTYPGISFDAGTGDMIYLFSDGMADQFGGDRGRKLTPVRLRGLLETIAHLPAEQQKQQLHELFILWKGTNEQTDDAMILGIRL